MCLRFEVIYEVNIRVIDVRLEPPYVLLKSYLGGSVICIGIGRASADRVHYALDFL